MTFLSSTLCEGAPTGAGLIHSHASYCMSSDGWFRSPRTSNPALIPPSSVSPCSPIAKEGHSSASQRSASASPSSVFDFYAFRTMCAGKNRARHQSPFDDPVGEVVLGFVVPSSTSTCDDDLDPISYPTANSPVHTSNISHHPPGLPHGLLSQLMKDHDRRQQTPLHNFSIMPGVRRCLAPGAKEEPANAHLSNFDLKPKQQLGLTGSLNQESPASCVTSIPKQLLNPQTKLPPHSSKHTVVPPVSPSHTAASFQHSHDGSTPIASETLSWFLDRITSTAVRSAADSSYDLVAPLPVLESVESGASAQERALPSIDQALFSGLSQQSLDVLEDRWREYCQQGGSYQANVSRLMADISTVRRAHKEQARQQAPPPPRQRLDRRTQWWTAAGPGFLDALAPANSPRFPKTRASCAASPPRVVAALGKALRFFRL